MVVVVVLKPDDWTTKTPVVAPVETVLLVAAVTREVPVAMESEVVAPVVVEVPLIVKRIH